MYREWAFSFPKDVEVMGVQLPGRETRFSEPARDNLLELAEELEAGLGPYFDRPFAFFGHSLGAWIAFEVVRALRRQQQPLPAHLFVSARRAPQITERFPPLHGLTDQELIDTVQQRYGGIPAAVLADADLMQLLLPVLRADLKAAENYQYGDEAPMSLPISAFGGLADHQVLPSELDGWREQTRCDFDVKLFPGSHFYLNESSRLSLVDTVHGRLVQILGHSAATEGRDFH